MTDDNNTTAGLEQADEDILSYTASDEALEAAAGAERGGMSYSHDLLSSFRCC
jgi:hypothetical protein